jgi:hypothetical protein
MTAPSADWTRDLEARADALVAPIDEASLAASRRAALAVMPGTLAG